AAGRGSRTRGKTSTSMISGCESGARRRGAAGGNQTLTTLLRSGAKRQHSSSCFGFLPPGSFPLARFFPPPPESSRPRPPAPAPPPPHFAAEPVARLRPPPRQGVSRLVVIVVIVGERADVDQPLHRQLLRLGVEAVVRHAGDDGLQVQAEAILQVGQQLQLD